MPYGVSNSFKRGMKTYARRIRQGADVRLEQPLRIYMDEKGFVIREAIGERKKLAPQRDARRSSSPAPRTLFSEGEATVTPPSSPPQTSPLKEHKPSFSFLKRKRPSSDDSEPLSEVNDNANSRRPPAAKRTRLTQMQIDLGGDMRRSCKECGMEYIPSNREDAALHKDFHSMNVKGVDLGTGFSRDTEIVEKFGFGEVVAMVDTRSTATQRKRLRRVLDVVKNDLGAVDVPDEKLWATPKQDEHDRFKLFLYLAGDRCVGLCLAQRIRNASKVVSQPQKLSSSMVSSSCVQAEASVEAMLLGISRIWVSKAHRRKGIATTLLDCARQNFFFGIDVPKKMVAFSQPTESGKQLAEQWFDEGIGWHVYADSI